MKKEILIIVSIIVLCTLFVNALSLEERDTLKNCRSICRLEYKNSSQNCKIDYNLCNENCTNLACKKECSLLRSQCMENSIQSYKSCKSNCTPQVGCLNNTIKINEKFTQGCDVCQCNKNNKIRCVKDNFCNFS